jgi:hypothetical protein
LSHSGWGTDDQWGEIVICRCVICRCLCAGASWVGRAAAHRAVVVDHGVGDGGRMLGGARAPAQAIDPAPLAWDHDLRWEKCVETREKV